MTTNNLAKRLKELRLLRGMSQEYLAEESRVSLRTIQRIENEESTPMGETIKRIAVALDIELSEFVGITSLEETNNLKGTIIFLKKQLSKTTKKSEIKTFKSFISVLKNLKEKDLNTTQLKQIENYITYLELEKIPSFSNEIYKLKLKKFKTYLNKKLRFIPTNYYTGLALIFVVPFIFAFSLQTKIENEIRMIVISVSVLLVIAAFVMDLKMKKQGRSLNF